MKFNNDPNLKTMSENVCFEAIKDLNASVLKYCSSNGIGFIIQVISDTGSFYLLDKLLERLHEAREGGVKYGVEA